ncbi:hypothetical protein [Halomonas salipaludis]|uniref:Uncharacterized protein n=1 Tax=Halomonas salipaludis TaxID=2032625 RepID=A0A2A2F3W2_9GAMM|nr:hypothetical protein [Halomonas salipaludis]PAU79213.1 hypothetical protein CK498_02260 [Halomonas salipaludis]
MHIGSKSEIAATVGAQARSRQPGDIERALAARVFGAVDDEAGQLLTTGCEPVEETEPLTLERLTEMVDRLRLRNQSESPFPPSHPLHGAWEITERRRRDWLMAVDPSC